VANQNHQESRSNLKTALLAVGLALVVAACVLWPDQAAAMAWFVIVGLVAVAPLVLPGILLAAWIMASGADAHIARAFEARVFLRCDRRLGDRRGHSGLWRHSLTPHGRTAGRRYSAGTGDGVLVVLARHRSGHAGDNCGNAWGWIRGW